MYLILFSLIFGRFYVIQMTCTSIRCHYLEFVYLARKHILRVHRRRRVKSCCARRLFGTAPHPARTLPNVFLAFITQFVGMMSQNHRTSSAEVKFLRNTVLPRPYCMSTAYTLTHPERERVRTLFYLTTAPNPFHLARLTCIMPMFNEQRVC